MLLYRIVNRSAAALIALCFATGVCAQYEAKNFIRYSVKDGLCDNLVNCLQQDEQGYLWIGTDAGLSRFDGNTFRIFYRGTPPVRLPSIKIGRLKRFGPDRLGIFCSLGFLVLNTKNYSVQPYLIQDSTAISTYLNNPWDAVELPDKSFAVTSAAGFYRFNAAGKLIYRHDAYRVQDIGRKRILYGRDMFRLNENDYLTFVDEKGIALYQAADKSFTELKAEDPLRERLGHSPFVVNDYWTAKYQMSKDEFIFIRSGSNKIVYYNHAQQKQVASPLAFHITDSINWESKITMLSDSVMAINSSTNGFYTLSINRRTGAITADGIKHLRNYTILCLFLDKDKRLWAGTTEGLLQQQLKTPVISSWFYQPSGGEKYTGGFSVVYRYKDKLYAGRFSFSKGLAIIDPVTMKLIKEIDFFSDKSNWNEVRSIEMYHKDTLWLGTTGGLLWFDTRSQRYGKVLDEKKYPWAAGLNPSLAPARADGYAWMCAVLNAKVVRYHIPSRTFTLFTPQTNPALPFERVKHVVYDAYGNVWIAGHSLARWNNKESRFDTLITTYGGDGRFNDDIVTIRADDKGSLWFHNSSNGLTEYRIKESKFVNYSMKDGLPSDLLNALSPVKENKIWAATNSQLYLFNNQTKQVTVYDYRDGLPEHTPTGRKIYPDDQTGQLYLCSNEYLVRFPFSPPEEKDGSSELMIEELSTNHQKTWYHPQEPLHIKYNEKNLSLAFSVIDFEKRNYQFFYRLNTTDNWNHIGNQRIINLSNLAPGKYTLELKASGKPGVEKSKSLLFVIEAPYWQTGWFLALGALLLAAAIYYIYRRRVSYIRKKAAIDSQLSQTEMKALQAQMNPHFIFNSLNSIREMILNNENKDASHYLSKFAHLIRITLDQSSQSLVSLRNTVDYLQRYMEMEQIRNSLFTYSITTAERLDLDETLIPPMLIQPFIENSLWHGVTASNKQIHVSIHFKKENDMLICTVEDNGVGVHHAQKNKTANGHIHRPHGISNIKNRINLLNEKHNLHCRVIVQDKKEMATDNNPGTLVTIELPMEIN